ncbi:hypothetical protein MRB53_042344 [Persea americana]|nr:hypothetical protein MRB53_042344 [Persea americana]
MDTFCEARPMYPDGQIQKMANPQLPGMLARTMQDLNNKQLTNEEIYRSDQKSDVHTNFVIQLFDHSNSKVALSMFVYGLLARKCFEEHLSPNTSMEVLGPLLLTLSYGRTLSFLPDPECMFRWTKEQILQTMLEVLNGVNALSYLTINTVMLREHLAKSAKTIEVIYSILDDNEKSYITITAAVKAQATTIRDYRSHWSAKRAHGEAAVEEVRDRHMKNGFLEFMMDGLKDMSKERQLAARKVQRAEFKANNPEKVQEKIQQDCRKRKADRRDEKALELVEKYKERGMTFEIAD